MRSWERNAALLEARYPQGVAIAQAACERRRQVCRAYKMGAQYKDVVAASLVSQARIYQLAQKGWREYDAARRSPAEFYDAVTLNAAVRDLGRLVAAYERLDVEINRLHARRPAMDHPARRCAD